MSEGAKKFGFVARANKNFKFGGLEFGRVSRRGTPKFCNLLSFFGIFYIVICNLSQVVNDVTFWLIRFALRCVALCFSVSKISLMRYDQPFLSYKRINEFQILVCRESPSANKGPTQADVRACREAPMRHCKGSLGFKILLFTFLRI